ncbi:GDSL-type esterase/lipase family protein [Anaerosporobacter sp.]|uniref:GDSL-type esterase/lipase family protein n=1 Tax=Anaerosporobacter sp. TaxID=1872529 RepID=UPI00286F5E7F|nr:GDSL-type esterase/lipase family protein [Anaerosporobacter sp.]
MERQDIREFYTKGIEDYQKIEHLIKVNSYHQLNKNVQKGQILFTGSSLMEQFPVRELCLSQNINKIIYNRGIGGFTTDDFLSVIDTVLFDLSPSKVFINIGTNDIRYKEDSTEWLPHLTDNLHLLFKQCKEKLPTTQFYLMAYYPVNAIFAQKYRKDMADVFKIRNNQNITLANKHLQQIADLFDYTYIDCNQGLTDEAGNLKEEYTVDGMHMYPHAYSIVLNNMKPYL